MIEINRVTRRYGTLTAVDDVSFSLKPGEIAGFLGPNGAGKSTLLRMISTWLNPSVGAITVAGFSTITAALEVRRRLGYLPEHNPLYEGMRVDRFLAFVGRVHGLAGAALVTRTEWVTGRCQLATVLDRRINQCSKGFRQRIGLAAALIHDPPVIVLDEPTHGLDPLQVVAFREFLRGLAHGRTIIFSSHILSEVVTISDRVLVLHQGRLIADDPVATLRAQAAAGHGDIERLILDRVRASAAPPAVAP